MQKKVINPQEEEKRKKERKTKSTGKQILKWQ